MGTDAQAQETPTSASYVRKVGALWDDVGGSSKGRRGSPRRCARHGSPHHYARYGGLRGSRRSSSCSLRRSMEVSTALAFLSHAIAVSLAVTLVCAQPPSCASGPNRHGAAIGDSLRPSRSPFPSILPVSSLLYSRPPSQSS